VHTASNATHFVGETLHNVKEAVLGHKEGQSTEQNQTEKQDAANKQEEEASSQIRGDTTGSNLATNAADRRGPFESVAEIGGSPW
jgi:Sec-independent protein translocase protein TatA